MSAQSQGNKGTKILIIVFAVVVVLLIGTVIVLANNVKKAKEENSKSAEIQETGYRQTVINEETADQVVEDMFTEDDNVVGMPSSYETVMTTTWHFPDGESESTDAYVENSKANSTSIYFDVRLSDTQENIYESPVLPLGTHVDKIKLMKDLDPGTYDCELTYHLIDDEQNTLGTIDVVVTVIVAN